MKISRLGEAPDYRFSLANERTFLAWIRTALGFLAAGVGLDQLAPDFATPVIRELLALLLCLFSGGLAMYGYLRWLRNEKAMRLKEDLPYTNSLLIISLILMVVAVIVMGLCCMPDSRKARRIADPGLQPERTSLAWFRTMLGYGALMALAIKHNWHQAGMLFWISIGILAIVALILWHYTRNRNLMDVTNSDFSQFHVVRDKFLISLAVLSLAILFAVTHIHQLIVFIERVA